MGGVIRRDEHGNPNGVLEEPPAREPCSAISPLPRKPTGWKVSRPRRVYEGVTTAQDGFTATGDWGALKRAHELGLLRNRVQILPGVAHGHQHVQHARFGTQLTADGKISLGAAKPRGRQPPVLHRLPEQSVPQGHL